MIRQTEEQAVKEAVEKCSYKKECKQENQIEFALQQFIGFTHGKKGFPVRELVSSMGLKKEEWDRLNEEEDMALGHLDVEDCEEIDKYFEEASQKVNQK